MSDRNRSTSRVLNLLGRPGVYETLLVMFNHGDTATFGQIAADGCRKPLAHLRSLAAEGFVVSPTCGTWDSEPALETPFNLTTPGHTLVRHLNGFREWAREYPSTRSRFGWLSPRRPHENS